MRIICSEGIRAKLQAKHEVSLKDVYECFENRSRGFLEDSSEEHRTEPPTLWFIAPNNHGRLLKVCFVFRDGAVYLRTAFPPSASNVAMYEDETERT